MADIQSKVMLADQLIAFIMRGGEIKIHQISRANPTDHTAWDTVIINARSKEQKAQADGYCQPGFSLNITRECLEWAIDAEGWLRDALSDLLHCADPGSDRSPISMFRRPMFDAMELTKDLIDDSFLTGPSYAETRMREDFTPEGQRMLGMKPEEPKPPEPGPADASLCPVCGMLGKKTGELLGRTVYALSCGCFGGALQDITALDTSTRAKPDATPEETWRDRPGML